MKRTCLCLIVAAMSLTSVLAEEPATPQEPTKEPTKKPETKPAAKPAGPVLLAGAREVQITSTRDREKVHQDMYARALVFSDGSTRVALLTLDCVGLGWGHTQQIRKGIEKATGIPADHVTINNSHSHNVGWPAGEWEDGLSYGDWLVKTCVALTAEAKDRKSVV